MVINILAIISYNLLIVIVSPPPPKRDIMARCSSLIAQESHSKNIILNQETELCHASTQMNIVNSQRHQIAQFLKLLDSGHQYQSAEVFPLRTSELSSEFDNTMKLWSHHQKQVQKRKKIKNWVPWTLLPQTFPSKTLFRPLAPNFLW